MALVTIISGRYSGTYTIPAGSPVDIGIMKSPGYKVGFTPAWRWIDSTDAYASQIVEGVWRGWQSVTLDCISEEWKTQPLRASNPAAAYAPSGATNFDAGVVGRLATALAGAIILTSTSGTPAAAAPTTTTFSLAVVRPGFSMEWIYDSDIRECPFSFQILPVTDGGSPVGCRYFSAT